ncbi:MAG: hypothetical protein ACM3H7_05265 [Acidobacteriaceae bacterium]
MRSWLNIRVIFVAILFALGIFALLVYLLWNSKAPSISTLPGTAVLSVIKAPTQTPLAPKTTDTPTPEPTRQGQEPAPAGNILVGNYVQVTGTEGDGLRLHVSAGVSSEVHYVALEAEVFIVKEGPIDADGYQWWYLQDPYTQDAVGWGVANYLAVVKNP